MICTLSCCILTQYRWTLYTCIIRWQIIGIVTNYTFNCIVSVLTRLTVRYQWTIRVNRHTTVINKTPIPKTFITSHCITTCLTPTRTSHTISPSTNLNHIPCLTLKTIIRTRTKRTKLSTRTAWITILPIPR